MKTRIRGVQGGQGAGKTISILILIINHLAQTPNREAVVVSDELTKMRGTVIKDFIKLLSAINMFDLRKFNKSMVTFSFPNGSFIKFIGLDKEDIGKGYRSDILYVFEANKVKLEAARQFISRSGLIILDWNPDSEFWFHDEYLDDDDCSMVTLTFEDNEYLSEHEISSILKYKEKGYNPDGTIKNKYWANKWRVYGLGLPGALDGVIFSNWDKYKSIPGDTETIKVYGVDWGGNDPTVYIELNVDDYNERLYVKQHLYQPQIRNSELIKLIQGVNINNDPVACDSSRKDKIFELQTSGIQAFGATKGEGSVIEGIERMQEYEILIHESSIDLLNEFKRYKWAHDKSTGKTLNIPEDKNNHGIDAIRYALRFYKKVIKPY